MKKEQLMRYGTIALILIFVIEIFGFLFTNNPFPSALPSPSPTATATPEEFQGFNVSEGYVIGLTRELLVACNTTENVEPGVRAIAGVGSVSFDPANARLGIDMEENASVSGVVKELRASLSAACKPTILRRAFVKLPDVLNFTDGASKSKLVFASQLQCLQQISFSPCFAFVQPATQENTTPEFAIFIRMTGESVNFVTAEEPERQEPLVFRFAEVEARVTEVFAEGRASAAIPWESRNSFTENGLEKKLNGTVNYSQLTYSPLDLIYVNSTDNETASKVQNLSFAKSVQQGDDGLQLEVFGNVTNQDEVLAELIKLGLHKNQIRFPESQFSLAFVYDEDAPAIIRNALSPFKVRVGRWVAVELVSPTAASEQLEADLTEKRFELYAGNSTINATIPIRLSAVVQGGEASVLQADEIIID